MGLIVFSEIREVALTRNMKKSSSLNILATHGVGCREEQAQFPNLRTDPFCSSTMWVEVTPQHRQSIGMK